MSRVRGIEKNLLQKIIEQLKNCSDRRNENRMPSDSPFTGIRHGDFWVNNVMFTTGKNKTYKWLLLNGLFIIHLLFSLQIRLGELAK